ncbi:dirigent protein 22-like [Momordica charantia]|uniref:Dirigent protein n=1 Tax=Momordica charantia TaxID=3673 RepID=A0A6J1DK16_MOMCH|nr:dirigent protein 22-like [Momordica charantia]
MAGISSFSAAHFLFLFLFVFFSSAVVSEDDSFVTTVEVEDKRVLGLKNEKLTHFRVYWHDVLGGKNPTAVQIVAPAPASNASTSSFGLVRMIDNPLTAGPDPRSKLWGKAQGLYAAASQENLSFLMAMNFAFMSGKYGGSSITILGRNPVGEKVREMPVIGGSGAFRFARGYARVRTLVINPVAAVVEYNVYVLHY